MRISREGHLVTLINVFETKPEQQQALIDAWLRFVESVKEEPGLIGTALHRSTNGTRVVNYAQWRSDADYSRFVQKYREQMEAHRPLAESVDPHLYEVVYLTERRGNEWSERERRVAGACVSSPFPARIEPMERWQAKRSKDHMAKPYRVTAFVRINNIMMSSLLRLGITVWSFSLLTVRGRKSGKPIVIPVAIFVQEQKRYLIATYGVVNWVRNLRAAGGEATLTQRRHSERIRAIEIAPEAAAPIIREALRSGPPGVPALIFRVYRALLVLPYLDVTENASLEKFECEVLTHPVFLVQPAL